MGRHGGGSSSGGSHGSSSGGSSRSSSSGSSTRTSTKAPFLGCYNRSYYDRHGRYHTYYTSDKDFGTGKGWSKGIIFALIFITIHMFLMVGAFLSSIINIGHKINGDASRIEIIDNINIMTIQEENEVMEVLEKVYEKSGMPVSVYTANYDWKNHYDSIEIYSEALYYQMGLDEDSMIIVFTCKQEESLLDFEYDMYCGDNTIKCFSDETFDKLLDNFYKSLLNSNLSNALIYSWNLVMDDLASTSINYSRIGIIVFLLGFYSIFYVVLLQGVKNKNQAYEYFKDNPDKLDYNTMKTLAICPNCKANNTNNDEICPYCGTSLIIK
ncbi:MAG: zinc ribbon domain-containing protein [Erysipelotrichaceae bacterium]|nr:zinc ribbon domain-containing protein [Erysipelotrichaceae bacterium]